MRKVLLVILIILLIPVFLVTCIVIHELGHTVLARVFGDPNAVFYLVKFDEDGTGMCLGCTNSDVTKLSWEANIMMSLGGLLATQLVALIALFLVRLFHNNRLLRYVFSVIALGFAFLDVPVQMIQGLLYNLNDHIWPTDVDLMDFMLLMQVKIGVNQLLLKGLLLTVAITYLSLFIWIFKKNRMIQKG